jgi:uncharacterized membrane protein YidH (DUF202 family)
MENIKQEPPIKEYAGGWITERAGTEVPGFLKLAFIVIVGGCLTYFFVFMYGETTHEDRGALVRQMNAATEASAVMMYLVAAMVIVFGVIVVAFAFHKSHEE